MSIIRGCSLAKNSFSLVKKRIYENKNLHSKINSPHYVATVQIHIYVRFYNDVAWSSDLRLTGIDIYFILSIFLLKIETDMLKT